MVLYFITSQFLCYKLTIQRSILFRARKDLQSCLESNSNYLYNLLSFHPSTQTASPLGTITQCLNPQTFIGYLTITHYIGHFVFRNKIQTFLSWSYIQLNAHFAHLLSSLLILCHPATTFHIHVSVLHTNIWPGITISMMSSLTIADLPFFPSLCFTVLHLYLSISLIKL